MKRLLLSIGLALCSLNVALFAQSGVIPAVVQTQYAFISLDDMFVPLPYAEKVIKPAIPYEDNTTVTTVEGKKIAIYKTQNGLYIEGEENKIVLLEMYGYSCPHCQDAIPGYNEFKAKYPKDVYILTVEVYGLDNASLKQYAQDRGMTYDTVAMENAGKLIDFFGQFTGWTPPVGVPALLVFSKDGDRIKYYYPQDLPKDDVDALIQSLL